ncbi:hypothetical protein KC332_g7372 [Hortaea werneckii]|nr:hypothetical protein KC358_g7016 [Hortaea werneckii]KAI6835513.1 hypothetical protein KC350_g6485 [Hortaea werneckii]KAI6930987.1 hypothetical protein KC348_g7406 [Hortaea werneckii]KAI6935588.1 hypothetical protein KC341_g6819 [Hortaea werneckii]KAI6970217.1 hypothetical protein KC321_g7441 [Hortaea werneckii]
MSFPHQRRVAQSNDDDQQDIQTFSSPLQGYAPPPSIHDHNPPFLVVDGYELPLKTNDYQRNMSYRSQNPGHARTPLQLLDAARQAMSSSTDPACFNQSETFPAWDYYNQRETPKTIAPALLHANHPHAGFEVAPAEINGPLPQPQTGPTTPRFTDHALPITAGNTKRRKVVRPETDSMQTSVANFTADHQQPSYNTNPMSTASHSFNNTRHSPSCNPEWMPTAELDFTLTQQEPVRRKSRMQNAGTNFTANQQRSSNSVYPAVNTPTPSHGQVSSYGNPVASVSPQVQYQQPAGNHNIHHNAWSGPPSDQYGVGHSSAIMPPAQPTSHALMAFNQHDSVLSPGISQEQDFSYFGPASSLPFNTQQPAEYDIFHQDVWSSPPSGQHGAEMPTSSIPTAQQTPAGFFQDNQQGNHFSSGPQINVYQQNNVVSSGVQINQPSNVLSSGPQVNQLNNSLSSGPQVNQQGVGIPSANMPPSRSAPFVPPQVNQQGNVLSGGPQVNQQNVGIPPANAPSAPPGPVVPAQANQQGNVPTSGPQANQQKNFAANGQQVTIPHSTTQTSTGAVRSAGHNADMKFLQAVPPEAALPAMELSLTELWTYFPLHTTWPYVLLRFKAAGAPPKRIAQGQLLVRGAVNDQRATDTIWGRIRHQSLETGRLLLGSTIYTQRAAEYQLKTLSAGRVSYDVSAYTARRYHQSKVVDMKLVDIARGVRRHPSGVGAGKFTQVIQHVLGNLATKADTTTVDAVAMANDPQLAFSYPAEQATDDWDEKCLEDMMQELANAGVL